MTEFAQHWRGARVQTFTIISFMRPLRLPKLARVHEIVCYFEYYATLGYRTRVVAGGWVCFWWLSVIFGWTLRSSGVGWMTGYSG